MNKFLNHNLIRILVNDLTKIEWVEKQQSYLHSMQHILYNNLTMLQVYLQSRAELRELAEPWAASFAADA